MSRNGSGLFQVNSTGQPVVANTLIEASVFNAFTADVATALSASIANDGQTTITANLPMAGFKHTGVGDANARTQYASLGQSQDGKLNWVDGGGTADAITATYSPAITALVDGQLCFVRATAENATTTPTFAPNGLTARTIVKGAGAALVAGDIPGDQAEIILRYDLANTRWVLLNPYIPAVATTATTATTATNLAAGSAGTIPYQSAAGTTAMLAAGTAGQLIVSGASAPALVIAGTSGQILKSNGSSAPSWATYGPLIAYTRYTASTTHTKNTATTKQFVRVKGGGGGGCSSDGTSFGGGGGEGEERTFFDSSPPSTSSITIGAGGTAGTGGTFSGGTNGGNSSYVGSSTITANGGGGGGVGGGTGGTGGSGGNQIIGRAGGAPHTNAQVSGNGGGGVQSPADASSGVSAPANTGFGGSAASKASATGGNGAAGFVEIWEYA